MVSSSSFQLSLLILSFLIIAHAIPHYATLDLSPSGLHNRRSPQPLIEAPPISKTPTTSLQTTKQIPSNPLANRDIESVFRTAFRIGLITNFYVTWRNLEAGSPITAQKFFRPYTQPIKDMYTTIRHKAANEWSKYPERNALQITYGKVMFWLVARTEARTIPWTYIEEIAHIFLIALATGLGCFFEGWVSFLPVGVVWVYIAAVVPPTEKAATITAKGDGG